jgi:hypothetical protein
MEQVIKMLRRRGIPEIDINILLSFYPKGVDGKYSETDMVVIQELVPL